MPRGMFSWRKKNSKSTNADEHDAIWNKYKTDYGEYGTLRFANSIIETSKDPLERKAAFYFLLIDCNFSAKGIIETYDKFLSAEEKYLIKFYEQVLIYDKDPEQAAQDLAKDPVAPRTSSLRADSGRAMYSNVCTRKCSERRTFMRGGTALNLYVEPGASFRGHHWRTMLKTMYADKLPSKFDLYHARGKVDMAALVDGNVHGNMSVRGYK